MPALAKYNVQVTTGDFPHAGTLDKISIILFGTKGESNKTTLFNLGKMLYPGTTCSFQVPCYTDLGDILLIRLFKEKHVFFPSDDWFCSNVLVKDHTGKRFQFPCYQWIVENGRFDLIEGKGTFFADVENNLQIKHCQNRLEAHRKNLRWTTFAEGIPRCVDIQDPNQLPAELRFSFTKNIELGFTFATAVTELKLKGLTDMCEPWENLDDLSHVFCFKKTYLSEYTHHHWTEDSFFGYQYLNGCNPIIIQKCIQIPKNFPVTNSMVSQFLNGGSLDKEIKARNIFLVDYKLLDNVPPNVIDGVQQYLPAPLCLLYKDKQDQLLPIAIQLKQKSGPENPIFLPSDLKYDWLLAKTYVRSADFNYHQLVSHLLRTHLMAEVFCMATYRQLPSIHPLFKLLVNHMRYTLQINIMARNILLAKDGIFDKAASTGGGGFVVILQRALDSLTYSSLCLPENIKARGMENIPNYYYRDDGIQLWKIINRYVKKFITFYYKKDKKVKDDQELQRWIKEIFTEGFLGKTSTGIPQSFSTLQQLIGFVTMVIFTCSAQHAAVNSGQFDFYGWMPNGPSTMTRPPPTNKGRTTMPDLLQSMSDVKNTCRAMSAVWLLSRQSSDFVMLGHSSSIYSTEEKPLGFLEEFREDLKNLASEIRKRNKGKQIPYNYLLPDEIESSVAI
ncbi:polyunsaturated fatty acid lipoxygenase ALOX8-like [Erpetoichthys calabaricus]|uniref:polyunsaturated fatty acid lipoxygenase ALOX8-like n=1 Tax=Erpetoichthys calabaricus TaxID=27687 RepID=UPI002234264A|nr:polyunsaturated fatty acid lipoxygenase ALOX8-like [Erpetoichthys calabaricus]